MLRNLRADWRRGRALKFIRLGETFNYTWTTESAGDVVIRVGFDADDDTLVMTIHEIGAADPISPEGKLVRARVGLRELRTILDWIARMASDLGYRRLRVEGPRTKRAAGYQRFEFDLARFSRGGRQAG